jgi:aspartate/methionine/tyrosine aminotransferase
MAMRSVKHMDSSLIRDIFEMASSESLNLGIGMPYCPASAEVKQAIVQALEDDETFYTPNAGITLLREEVALRYTHQGEGSVSSENVLITTGAAQGLFLAMVSLLSQGETVLLPDPGYPAYRNIARFLGCRIETYGFDYEKMVVDSAELLEKSSKGPRMIILNAPSNPTGAVLTKEQFSELAVLLEKSDSFAVSDEVYGALSYDAPFLSAAGFLPRERTIILSSLSKESALTGLRVGWCYSDKRVIKKLKTIHQHMVSCAASLSQWAAVEAVRRGGERIKTQMGKNRTLMESFLKEIPGFEFTRPPGGLYFFVNVSAYTAGRPFAEELLKKEQVITVPGEAFGKRGGRFVRISFGASPADIEEGCRRIRRFVYDITRA